MEPASTLRHVHIGAGKIGMGFVAFLANKCKLRTSIINRNTSRPFLDALKTTKVYKLEYFDGSEAVYVGIDDVLLYNQGTDDDVLRAISHKNTFLITTAIGESNLATIAPTIAKGLLQREAQSTNTFIIACENGLECSTRLHDEIRHHIPVDTRLCDIGVFFMDCIVDQICPSEPDIDKKTRTPYIEVENYREWLISDDYGHTDLRQALDDHDIKFISSRELDLYQKRKLWLVNGFFLGLAIYGYVALGADARLAAALEKREEGDFVFSQALSNELIAAIDTYDTEQAEAIASKVFNTS